MVGEGTHRGQGLYRKSPHLLLTLVVKLKLLEKSLTRKKFRSLFIGQKNLLPLPPWNVQEGGPGQKVPRDNRPSGVKSKLSSGGGAGARSLQGAGALGRRRERRKPAATQGGVLTCHRCCCHPAAAAPCGGQASPVPGSVRPAHCSAAGSSASPAPGPVGTVRTSVGKEPSGNGRMAWRRPVSGLSDHLLEPWPAWVSRGPSRRFCGDGEPQGCLQRERMSTPSQPPEFKIPDHVAACPGRIERAPNTSRQVSETPLMVTSEERV